MSRCAKHYHGLAELGLEKDTHGKGLQRHADQHVKERDVGDPAWSVERVTKRGNLGHPAWEGHESGLKANHTKQPSALTSK